jgi:hypothetical protein
MIHTGFSENNWLTTMSFWTPRELGANGKQTMLFISNLNIHTADSIFV